MRRTEHRLVAGALLAILVPGASRAGVVISEIHYKPPPGDEALEFIELTNDSTTPQDISGFAFVDGVYFIFPDPTILGPRASIVVCANAAAVRARYGIANAVGDFTGNLDAGGGERITLANHAGVVVQSVRYRERGKWPSAPDGTGHTLSLLATHLDPAEPESWSRSRELGGTPGRPNFPTGEESYEVRAIVDRGADWRWAKGTGPFSAPESAWRAPTFDDRGWPSGPSGFGYGDDDDATVLSDMAGAYTTVAVRREVTLSAEEIAAPGDFYLGMDFDDGFVAYVNGVEVARADAGSVGEELPWTAVASGSREAGVEDLYRIPRERLVAGRNVIAILGLNFSVGSSDFSLIPRLIHRTISTVTELVDTVVLNELFRGATAGGGWVELHNRAAAAVDISGWRLTDDPARPDPYLLPAGSVIPPKGFLTVGESASGLRLSAAEVHLFLLRPSGTCATASVFERTPPPDAGARGWSECRIPDGGRLEWTTTDPTSGAPNRTARVMDIVINEIFYHPPDERLGEFLELYNKGASPVDLSGFRFDSGIQFTMPEGTVIGPGGYLVVAEDPRILSDRYGYEAALGPWVGVLADAGEKVRLVDRAGNPVDEVRYHEGGTWSRWADGGGSSLELIDPEQDNSFASAWDASDETGRAAWERLSFQVPAYVPAADSELHLLLAERGICRIDDVSIARDGGQNLIPNPGFETSTAGWTIEGTHIASRRIVTDARSGNACLEVVASSKGDTLVNRIEIETSPRMTAGPYEVSLWARWQRGGSLLVVHGEYTAGAYGGRPSPATNLSGNSLSAGLRLTIPQDLGTPGAENSVRAALRSRTGSGNLGPVLADFEHSPAAPPSGQAVSVRGRISAARGVASANVFWRTESAAGTFSSAPLFDDGFHQDGEAGDGVWGGEIPAFAQGVRVLFWVEAADLDGKSRRFPVDAPGHTCLFLVQGPLASNVQTALMVLDAARASELDSRQLHSNDVLPGAFVFDNSEVFYNVGIRYRGSPWGRPGRNNYRVRLEEDKPFRRGLKKLNLDNSGGGPAEGAALYLSGRNSGPSKPAPAADYEWVGTWLNGVSRGMHGLLEPTDRTFVDKWYGDADRSVLLKVEGRRQFDDVGNWTWDGASFLYRDANPESYRHYFIPGIRRSVDDWTRYIELSRIMDRRTTPNAAFDASVESILDVEQFLRVLSVHILQSDWDAFGVGNGHNGFLVLDPSDDRWDLLPFDMDLTFQSTSINFYPTSDPEVTRLMSRPWPRRVYFRVLEEYVDGRWSSRTSGPFLDAVQAATGIGMGGIKSHLDATATQVRSLVRSSSTVPFRILTNSGADFATEETSVELSGESPVRVASLLWLRGGQGDLAPVPAVWTTPTRWTAAFELPEGENSFEFVGFDSDGELVASATIRVTCLARIEGAFVRGDPNADRVVDISDPLATLFHLFHGREIGCLDAADFDDDGAVTLTDAILGLDWLFRDGSSPAAPFPGPGADPTADAFQCP